MNIKVKDLKQGVYYKLINTWTNEVTIVYYYYNPDAKTLGFGFNIADGGGFLSVIDIADDTVIIELKLSALSTGNGDLWSIVDDVDDIKIVGNHTYCIDIHRVLTAAVSDVSEHDELLYERELRNMSWVGDLRIIPFVHV